MSQQEDLSRPPAANRHRLPDERVGLTPLLHRRPRGLPNRRSLSERAAGRNLHPDGKGGLDDRGIDGVFRHRRFGEPAARSAAQGDLRQALTYAV